MQTWMTMLMELAMATQALQPRVASNWIQMSATECGVPRPRCGPPLSHTCNPLVGQQEQEQEVGPRAFAVPLQPPSAPLVPTTGWVWNNTSHSPVNWSRGPSRLPTLLQRTWHSCSTRTSRGDYGLMVRRCLCRHPQSRRQRQRRQRRRRRIG